MTIKSTPVLFALSLVALATGARAETERQLGAHEHGAAQLTLAAENQTLAVSLDTPAYNLVGFEQSPATDAQRDQVESARAALARADAVLDLPAAAQCVLMSHAVESAKWEGIDAHGAHDEEHHDEHEEHHDKHEEEHHDEHADDHDDDHTDEPHDEHAQEDEHHDDHDHDHDGGESAHSDVLVEWTYRCENPEALSTVRVSAFEHFPNLTDLQVQYIGDDWQGGAQLTPASPRLTLN